MLASFKQPFAVLPLVMSLAALGLVLGHIAVAGTARQADEGAAAHLWQLLMAGQLPLIGISVVTSLPLRPGAGLIVLSLQLLAALAALLPVYLLNW
jgi:hypothetical protein